METLPDRHAFALDIATRLDAAPAVAAIAEALAQTTVEAAIAALRHSSVRQVRDQPQRALSAWWALVAPNLAVPMLQQGGTSMKATLMGRPTNIQPAKDLTTAFFEVTKIPASMPKGVPAPPSTPTKYRVYIGAKQWKKAASEIDDPDEMLIIEGYACQAPGYNGITVYATSAKSKLADQRARLAQQQPQGEQAAAAPEEGAAPVDQAAASVDQG